jgi:hypothetical protein
MVAASLSMEVLTVVLTHSCPSTSVPCLTSTIGEVVWVADHPPTFSLSMALSPFVILQDLRRNSRYYVGDLWATTNATRAMSLKYLIIFL